MSDDRRKAFLAALKADLWAAQFGDRLIVVFDRLLRELSGMGR